MSRKQHIPGWKKALAGLGVMLLLLCPFTSTGQARMPGEFTLKAVFLYNFSQFADWPPKAFTAQEATFVIGILGKDPFGTALEEAIAGETVKGKRIVIQRYQNWTEIRRCHILFINHLSITNVKDVLNHLKGKHILTVSDDPGFVRAGGMIRFYLQQNKIRLQINPSAARAEDIMISSKLLRLAEILE